MGSVPLVGVEPDCVVSHQRERTAEGRVLPATSQTAARHPTTDSPEMVLCWKYRHARKTIM
jgi:hypothetical protein